MSETMERPKDRAFAKFYHEPVLDKRESEKAGRNIYKDVEFIEISKPEDKHFKHVGEVTAEHRARFALAYQHFKATQETPSDGTPLKLVPIFTPAQIATLAAMNITTLEKFAGQQPENVPPEFRDVHREAGKYLDAANDKGSLARKYAKLEEERDLLREEKAKLIDELGKANDELKKLKNAGKPQGGRAAA